MHEYRSLALIIIAIFVITLAGAYFSPTFSEQKSFLELFMMFGAVLFIISLLIVFATIGLRSFILYMALFLAIIMQMYGVEGAALFVGLTYFVWGSIFAMEVLLFYHGLKNAREWFEQRYTYKSFKMEYKAFYPMLWVASVFLEWIPSLLYRESFMKFYPAEVLKDMEKILPEK